MGTCHKPHVRRVWTIARIRESCPTRARNCSAHGGLFRERDLASRPSRSGHASGGPAPRRWPADSDGESAVKANIQFYSYTVLLHAHAQSPILALHSQRSAVLVTLTNTPKEAQENRSVSETFASATEPGQRLPPGRKGVGQGGSDGASRPTAVTALAKSAEKIGRSSTSQTDAL